MKVTILFLRFATLTLFSRSLKALTRRLNHPDNLDIIPGFCCLLLPASMFPFLPPHNVRCCGPSSLSSHFLPFPNLLSSPFFFRFLPFPLPLLSVLTFYLQLPLLPLFFPSSFAFPLFSSYSLLCSFIPNALLSQASLLLSSSSFLHPLPSLPSLLLSFSPFPPVIAL